VSNPSLGAATGYESMGRMNALEMALSIVVEQFPEALAAVLAGSSAAGTATATSDLDIVVVLAGLPAPYRETIRVDGVPVELFVHTADSLAYWYYRERAEGRCTLAHMLATGTALTGAGAESTQAAACRWVEAGPERWTSDQLDTAGMRSPMPWTTSSVRVTRMNATPWQGRCSCWLSSWH